MSHRRSGHPRRRIASRGFTIVEMLVVIAVIAALMAVLLASLQSAQRTGKRTRQMSDLRQVFNGWAQYAGTYGDSLLPGYIDNDVQNIWRVRFRSKAGTRIPASFCHTYPWRLLPFLDHHVGPLYDYLEVDDETMLRAEDDTGAPNLDAMRTISEHPAFGYNAYYLGGWWTSTPGSGVAELTFGNGTWTENSGATVRGRIVATKLGNVIAPDRTIAFCASTHRHAGFYKMDQDDQHALGSAWVVPSRLAQEQVWRPSNGELFQGVTSLPRQGDDIYAGALASTMLAQTSLVQSATGTGIQVYMPQSVPLRRFGPSVPAVNVDGSTGPLSIGELLNQSRWMNPANSADSSPLDFEHTPN